MPPPQIPALLDPGSALCYAFRPVNDFLLGIAQATPQGGALVQFAPLILIFGVFYFLIIRPQQKKAKQHQQMLSELKKGDDVVTNGGILGRITGIKDDEVTVQVQEGVRLRVLRSAVSGRGKTADSAKADAVKSS